MALYNLAANCNHGKLVAEIIWNFLVVRIRDSSISKWLQLDLDLTLEKVKKCIHQWEAVHEQQNIISGLDSSTLKEVDSSSINCRKHQDCQQHSNCGQHHSSCAHYTSAGNSKQKETPKQCRRCGKVQHTHNMCPVKDAICHLCYKKEHYWAQCLTKNASINNTTALDTAFLEATSSSSCKTTWYVDIQVGKQMVNLNWIQAQRSQSGCRRPIILCKIPHHLTPLTNYSLDLVRSHSMLWASVNSTSATKGSQVYSNCTR